MLLRKLLTISAAILLVSISNGQSTPANFTNYEQSIPGSAYKTKMVAIPGGSFTIGSSAGEKHRRPDEGPQKKVSVSPFWMSALEVTRDEFDVFYKDETTVLNSEVDAVTRPSAQYIDLTWGMGKEGGFPANSKQQFTALMYCRWLYKKTGVFYRLPTEAEWEYACRAGTTTTYFFGDDPKDLDKYAWFKDNSEGKYQKTGTKQPNPWGLYDMLGNVAEWTLDQYDPKSFEKIADNSTDPSVPVSPETYPKVLKGGSYWDDAAAVRPASRLASDLEWNKRDPQIPQSRWWLTDAPNVGFRILRPAKQPSPQEAEDFYKLHLGQ